MRDRIQRIERDRLLECGLRGPIVAARALDQTERIPDGRGTGRGLQRPVQIRKGALEIVVDVIAVMGTRLERSRIFGIDRKRPLDAVAKLVAVVQQHRELRAGSGQSGIIRILPLSPFDHRDRCGDVFPKTCRPRLGHARIAAACIARRIFHAVGISQPARKIAAIGRDRASARVEAAFGLREQARRLAVLIGGTGDQCPDEVGTRRLRTGKAPARCLRERGQCLAAAIERQIDLGKCQPFLRRAGRCRLGLDTRPFAAHLGNAERGGRHPDEGVAERQMEEHLLTVFRRNDHDFCGRAADRGNRAFTLIHRDAAMGIAEFDHPFEDDK